MPRPPLAIVSSANPRIKQLLKLRKRRERDRQGVAVLEEPLVIRRALAAGHPLRAVFFCRELIPAPDLPLLEELLARDDLEAFSCTPAALAKAAYREQPQGLLVVALQVGRTLRDLDAAGPPPPLYVVLEAVEKPGNLGAVQRVADGAGAGGVILCGKGADPFNPNVLRASRGACFSVPTVAADPEEMLAWCAEHGITTVAASPDAAAAWDEVDLTGPAAILLGTEHQGLSPRLLGRADAAVRIPMRGRGDSLNVSVTAAVMLYEALRQRRRAGV